MPKAKSDMTPVDWEMLAMAFQDLMTPLVIDFGKIAAANSLSVATVEKDWDKARKKFMRLGAKLNKDREKAKENPEPSAADKGKESNPGEAEGSGEDEERTLTPQDLESITEALQYLQTPLDVDIKGFAYAHGWSEATAKTYWDKVRNKVNKMGAKIEMKRERAQKNAKPTNADPGMESKAEKAEEGGEEVEEETGDD